MATPLPSIDDIHARIQELRQQLDESSPGMALHLLKIHADIRKSPELVHVLSEEEIATIVAGLQQQSKVVIVSSPAPKTTKAKEKKLADLEI